MTLWGNIGDESLLEAADSPGTSCRPASAVWLSDVAGFGPCSGLKLSRDLLCSLAGLDSLGVDAFWPMVAGRVSKMCCRWRIDGDTLVLSHCGEKVLGFGIPSRSSSQHGAAAVSDRRGTCITLDHDSDPEHRPVTSQRSECRQSSLLFNTMVLIWWMAMIDE